MPKGSVKRGSIAEHIAQAICLQRSGHLRDASRLYEAVLRRDPSNPDALRLLAVALAEQGKLQTALQMLQRALKHAPLSPETHNNLGRVQQELKRFDDAADSYRKAIEIRPRYATALNNLGSVLSAVGRYEDAVELYRQVLAIDPGYVEALNNLGAALHALGHYAAAAERLRAALALRPNFADAQINLAHVLATLDRNDESVKLFKLALRSQPHNAQLQASLAHLLHRIGRYDESITRYKRACDIDAGLGRAHAGLAAIYQELGRLTEARRSLEQAIASEPRNMRYYLNLARIKAMEPNDPYLVAMLAIEEDIGSLSRDDQIDAHFAFGTALLDCGLHQRAFEHLLAGNALKREIVNYNEKARLARLERIPTMCTPSDLLGHVPPVPSVVPIFIVGMPRSGSTLIEQILASHRAVFAAGESPAFRQALTETGLVSAERPYPDAIQGWNEQELADFSVAYMQQVAKDMPRSRQNEVTHVTDKMLDNFRYVGLIHTAFPNARIIHACRDPVDTCLSCFAIQFNKVTFSYDLGELGRYYKAYASVMHHWRRVLPSSHILDVRYEDVVADFEAQARRIIDHCGLDWDEACLHFFEAVRPIRTASAAQVRQPLYNHAVKKWQLDERAIWPLLEALEDARAS